RGGEFDLLVEDAKTGEEVGRATSQGKGAVVRLDPRPGSRYVVRVRRLDESDPTKGVPSFHLTVLGGKLGTARKAGSIPFPGDGGHVVAVAAVDRTARRMSYSSCGPLTSGAKPDLCAVVPVATAWRPGQAFGGTSAAAPQAAGLGAILVSAGTKDVRGTLEKAARGRDGHSLEKGWGMAKLPARE
ncbi:MAG: S8 family serine peptidase, partial [Thermoleophilia bacterium]|nr:S8 family serine peptidase [Thermoleophilia bacterium]